MSEHYKQRALELAELGRRLAHPNPRVGAVVVGAHGEALAEGFHEGPGTPHAEAAALDLAGERARGGTLYVTLEPCCTSGHTGPCTEKIIAAGVSHVVVAMRDPNPAVDGRGFAALREAGVEVTVDDGEWHELCELLNEPFARYVRTGLPFLTYKAAVSLDGKVAGASGAARWISGTESRRAVHAMRAEADAVLVGAGTVRRDDPELTVREVGGVDPARIVISHDGDVPFEARVIATARETQTILAVESVAPERAQALAGRGVEVVQAAGLRDLLAALAGRGLLEILFEGGPTLAGALLADDLIDRVAFFVAPLVVGRGAPDLVALPAVEAPADGLRLTGVTWTRHGDDVLCRGRVARGGEGAGTRVGAARSPATERAGGVSGEVV